MALALVTAASGAAACTDLDDYSTTASKQYVGCVVPATFVRAGVSSTAQMCLTLDADHLQTAPGAITSNDGWFQSTPLRPIPQLWNDPLSTLSFGEGRIRNLVYMVTPQPNGSADGGSPSAGGDVTVVVSLMQGGDSVEVRLLRGAPPVAGTDAGSSPASNVFALFPLSLKKGGCASLSPTACVPDAQ